MPVLLPPARWDRWLAAEPLDAEEAAEILVPAADDAVDVREVSTAVSNVKNDAPELIHPIPVP